MLTHLKKSAKNGIVTANQCKQICDSFQITEKQLMVELLTIAESYSISPISKFKVGAVVKGKVHNSDGFSNLYLGSNLEFGTLYSSLHAEQSAISNAWLEGETEIRALAVSAVPCGHCRQFINEIANTDTLEIYIPSSSENGKNSSSNRIQSDSKQSDLNQNVVDENKITKLKHSDLLPSSFGPKDLNHTETMLQPVKHRFTFNHAANKNSESILKGALEQVNLSYAPYSHNYAGCSIQFISGEIYSGRYAENAAFNPSLSPFLSALSKARFNQLQFSFEDIAHVTLVEYPTVVSQKEMVQCLLKELCDVELSYLPLVRSDDG